MPAVHAKQSSCNMATRSAVAPRKKNNIDLWQALFHMREALSVQMYIPDYVCTSVACVWYSLMSC